MVFLFVKAYQPITGNKQMESTLTRAGRLSTGEIIVTVPALFELKRFEGFLNRGWVPISPVCGATTAHWLVSLYHLPTRVGGRSGGRTNQRFWPMELRFPHREGRCRPERTLFSSSVFLAFRYMTPVAGTGLYRPWLDMARAYNIRTLSN